MTDTLKITTTRNEADWDFLQGELLRGKNKGDVVMKPSKITPENLPTFLKWAGDKELCGILNGRMSNLSNGWTESATDPNDVFQADAFKTYAESFSARGETMDELEEQIDERLQDMAAAGEKGDAAVVLECAMAIKALKAEIESKKRTRKSKEAATATA